MPLRLLDAVKEEGMLDGRSHYNLACLYVALGRKHDDNALRHLVLGCLGSPSRTLWAPNDPSLLPLRKRRPAAWNKIFPPPKPPRPLASEEA